MSEDRPLTSEEMIKRAREELAATPGPDEPASEASDELSHLAAEMEEIEAPEEQAEDEPEQPWAGRRVETRTRPSRPVRTSPTPRSTPTHRTQSRPRNTWLSIGLVLFIMRAMSDYQED